MLENIVHSNIDGRKVSHAVKVLKEANIQWVEQAKKKPLFDGDNEGCVILQVTLKKIPELRNVQIIKIPLPHPLIQDTTEICLFTGDLDKRDKKADIEPTIAHYKDLLQKHGINCITEVIPLRQLRTDYKSFEAKRKLVAAYDIFLADHKIAQCLPKCLGKFFFRKRKFPKQVDLSVTNLQEHFDNVLSKTALFLSGKGSSCCVEVANLSWPKKKIIENVISTIGYLANEFPGSFFNIHSIFLKTYKSVALPIYIDFVPGNDIELPKLPPEPEIPIEYEEYTEEEDENEDVEADGARETEESDLDEEASERSDDADEGEDSKDDVGGDDSNADELTDDDDEEEDIEGSDEEDGSEDEEGEDNSEDEDSEDIDEDSEEELDEEEEDSEDDKKKAGKKESDSGKVMKRKRPVNDTSAKRTRRKVD